MKKTIIKGTGLVGAIITLVAIGWSQISKTEILEERIKSTGTRIEYVEKRYLSDIRDIKNSINRLDEKMDTIILRSD